MESNNQINKKQLLKETVWGSSSGAFYLIIAIISTICCLLNIISGINTILDITISFSLFKFIRIVKPIILLCANILVIVGLWQLYSNSKNKGHDIRGIKNIKSAFILNNFFSLLTLYLVTILFVIITALTFRVADNVSNATSNIDGSEVISEVFTTGKAGMIVILLLLIGVIVLFTMYLKSIKKCCDSGVSILNGQTPEKYSFVFGAVIMIAVGAVRLISSLSSAFVASIFQDIINNADLSSLGNIGSNISSNLNSFLVNTSMQKIADSLYSITLLLGGIAIIIYGNKLKSNVAKYNSLMYKRQNENNNFELEC